MFGATYYGAGYFGELGGGLSYTPEPPSFLTFRLNATSMSVAGLATTAALSGLPTTIAALEGSATSATIKESTETTVTLRGG